jgi:hypothetical protein
VTVAVPAFSFTLKFAALNCKRRRRQAIEQHAGENSEVLPACISRRGGDDVARLNRHGQVNAEARVIAMVVTSDLPRYTWPSPYPDAEHCGLAKELDAILFVAFGIKSSRDGVVPPLEVLNVSSGKF